MQAIPCVGFIGQALAIFLHHLLGGLGEKALIIELARNFSDFFFNDTNFFVEYSPGGDIGYLRPDWHPLSENTGQYWKDTTIIIRLSVRPEHQLYLNKGAQ